MFSFNGLVVGDGRTGCLGVIDALMVGVVLVCNPALIKTRSTKIECKYHCVGKT